MRAPVNCLLLLAISSLVPTVSLLACTADILWDVTQATFCINGRNGRTFGNPVKIDMCLYVIPTSFSFSGKVAKFSGSPNGVVVRIALCCKPIRK